MVVISQISHRLYCQSFVSHEPVKSSKHQNSKFNPNLIDSSFLPFNSMLVAQPNIMHQQSLFHISLSLSTP